MSVVSNVRCQMDFLTQQLNWLPEKQGSLQLVFAVCSANNRPIGIAKKKISCNPEGQFCQTCHDQTVTTWCVF